MSVLERYIGESLLKGQPSKKLGLVIKDGSVTNAKLAANAVSKEKLDEELQGKLDWEDLSEADINEIIN